MLMVKFVKGLSGNCNSLVKEVKAKTIRFFFYLAEVITSGVKVVFTVAYKFTEVQNPIKAVVFSTSSRSYKCLKC